MTGIHIHSSGEAGIFANAFLVESASAVVAVDATLTVRESKALRRKVDALGKPLVAVILTHAYPNHVAGLGPRCGIYRSGRPRSAGIAMKKASPLSILSILDRRSIGVAQ